jgi:hypothetical protein
MATGAKRSGAKHSAGQGTLLTDYKAPPDEARVSGVAFFRIPETRAHAIPLYPVYEELHCGLYGRAYSHWVGLRVDSVRWGSNARDRRRRNGSRLRQMRYSMGIQGS